jgi:magnesium chelatase subunit D
MLAAAILRHDTQQGGAPVTDARLVVVTDGRANVPLSDSQRGTRPSNVGRRGLDDAESAARAIRWLHRVQSMVIAPESRAAGYLATRLAESLAAPIRHAGPDVPEDDGEVPA